MGKSDEFSEQLGCARLTMHSFESRHLLVYACVEDAVGVGNEFGQRYRLSIVGCELRIRQRVS